MLGFKLSIWKVKVNVLEIMLTAVLCRGFFHVVSLICGQITVWLSNTIKLSIFKLNKAGRTINVLGEDNCGVMPVGRHER